MQISAATTCAQHCGFMCVAYFASSRTSCDLSYESPPPSTYTYKQIYPNTYPVIKEAVACPSIPEPWINIHDGYTFFLSDNCRTIQGGVKYDTTLPIMSPMSSFTLTMGSMTGPCPLLHFSGDNNIINIKDVTFLCTNSAPAIQVSNTRNMNLTIRATTNATVGVYIEETIGLQLDVEMDGPTTLLTGHHAGDGEIKATCNTYQRVSIYTMDSIIDVEVSPMCKFSSIGSTANSNLMHDYPHISQISMHKLDSFVVWLLVFTCLVYFAIRKLE